jgi:hypothetical protein
MGEVAAGAAGRTHRVAELLEPPQRPEPAPQVVRKAPWELEQVTWEQVTWGEPEAQQVVRLAQRVVRSALVQPVSLWLGRRKAAGQVVEPQACRRSRSRCRSFSSSSPSSTSSLVSAMPGHPADRAGLAHQHGIEPAAAALAARHRAELMAPLAEALAVGVVQLGRERSPPTRVV